MAKQFKQGCNANAGSQNQVRLFAQKYIPSTTQIFSEEFQSKSLQNK
jgi:hypothetical protein